MQKTIGKKIIMILFRFSKPFGLFFLTLLTGWTISIHATPLETTLRRDIQDFELDYYSHIDAALILSGVNEHEQLNHYLEWYESLVQTIRDFNFDLVDRVNSANKVFNYLHAVWLKKYQREATTLIDIIEKKEFNCVSATILYNLICEDLGWTTEAFETPTHVYTIFSNFTEPLMVENTTTMGFNIVHNLRDYSRILARYYPQKDIYRIGLDRLYLHEQKNGRPIDNTELLGLLAYNRAFFARKAGRFEEAYDYVLLAQNFNRDSRSNVNFEVNLYYEWGSQLIKKKRYHKAFNLFADAAYRYPENQDFAQNTRAAFFNAIQVSTEKNTWDDAEMLLDNIELLEILTLPDKNSLLPIFRKWASRFYENKERKNARRLLTLWESMLPDHPDLKLFQGMIDDL